LIAPPFHIYFDLFSGVVQAFVFTLLTIVYWAVEATHEGAHGSKDTKKSKIYTTQPSGPHKVRTS
jgi:F-type H+-transporting ATPase subunit a